MLNDKELVTASMALLHYIDMPECPEPEGVKAELREIIRKLDAEFAIRTNPEN